jgi:E3 ubiquitin-protein ligase HERC4
VLSFGSNNYGQLGHSEGSLQCKRPKFVKFSQLPPPFIVQGAAGRSHTLLLARDGSLWAIGDHSMGQKNKASQSTPQQVTTLAGLPLKKVSAGGCFSLALTVAGRVFAWGVNK